MHGLKNCILFYIFYSRRYDLEALLKLAGLDGKCVGGSSSKAHGNSNQSNAC